MDDSVLLKAKLLDLLEQRYQKDPGFFVNKSTISVELGITEEEAFRYADYLVNNKWVIISEPQTSRWRIMITDDGRKELERIRDVIVDAKKNNTNEQFGDAKSSKIEDVIEKDEIYWVMECECRIVASYKILIKINLHDAICL